jgi:hypothetical protein
MNTRRGAGAESTTESNTTAAGNADRTVAAIADRTSALTDGVCEYLEIARISVSPANRNDLPGTSIAAGFMLGGIRFTQAAAVKHKAHRKIPLIPTFPS